MYAMYTSIVNFAMIYVCSNTIFKALPQHREDVTLNIAVVLVSKYTTRVGWGTSELRKAALYGVTAFSPNPPSRYGAREAARWINIGTHLSPRPAPTSVPAPAPPPRGQHSLRSELKNEINLISGIFIEWTSKEKCAKRRKTLRSPMDKFIQLS